MTMYENAQHMSWIDKMIGTAPNSRELLDMRLLQYHPIQMLEFNIPILSMKQIVLVDGKLADQVHRKRYEEYKIHMENQTYSEFNAYMQNSRGSKIVNELVDVKLKVWLQRNKLDWHQFSERNKLQLIHSYMTFRYFPFPTFQTVYELKLYFEKYELTKFYLSIFHLSCKSELCLSDTKNECIRYSVSTFDCDSYILSINRLTIAPPGWI